MKKLLEALKLAAAYAAWKLAKTPEKALSLLGQLNPRLWRFEVQGVDKGTPEPEISVEHLLESYNERKLVVAFEAGEVLYLAKTRFKNDGSDELFVDGVAQSFVSFDFDFIGLKLVQVELRYNDPNGVYCYDRLYCKIS